jgi:hypothetical protein
MAARRGAPRAFARIAGWEATLATVVERLRCSQCGAHRAIATVRRQTKRDGNDAGQVLLD